MYVTTDTSVFVTCFSNSGLCSSPPRFILHPYSSTLYMVWYILRDVSFFLCFFRFSKILYARFIWHTHTHTKKKQSLAHANARNQSILLSVFSLALFQSESLHIIIVIIIVFSIIIIIFMR